MNDVLRRRAVEDSAEFVEAHLGEAMLFRTKDQIRAYALSRVPEAGLVLEFGVYEGEGINAFADALARRGDGRTLYGFDAFRGLSEDWYGKGIRAGTRFDLKGRLPKVRRNVELVVGWLEDTLDPFLAANADPLAFAHLDMDTYTPCAMALKALRPRCRPGTILLFDEHHGYPNWRRGEWRALQETFAPQDYVYRAFSPQQAVVELRADLCDAGPPPA